MRTRHPVRRPLRALALLPIAVLEMAIVLPGQAALHIAQGQDIQAKIDANAAGTQFQLAAGVHRLPSALIPKDGDVFTAAAGAVLSGARRLTEFSRFGTAWVATGPRSRGRKVGGVATQECRESAPRCAYPEDLFVDDVLQVHVPSLSAGGPGKWYFDDDTGRIYIWTDPAGQTVELSVTPAAFAGPARDVVIRGLTIEKFASPTHEPAVNAGTSRWHVEDCEIRFNHSAGLGTTDGSRVLRNRIHHNGAFGIIGAGTDILVADNEIAFNNTVGYNEFWGAGGSKWVHTDGLVVRGNYSHHNGGPGLWTDIDNINVVVERNRVEDNALSGIFHEIGYRAVIRQNSLRHNGTSEPFPYWVDGAGILVSSSANVEVYGNTLTDNWQGITGLESHAGPGTHGPRSLSSLFVHDNTIVYTSNPKPGSGRTGIADAAAQTDVFTRQNNRFETNTYRLASSAKYFFWLNVDITETDWRAYRQDVTGTFGR